MLNYGDPTGRKCVYFGEFRAHLDQRRLFQNGKRVRLTSKPFEALAFLIRNRDRVVTKDELLRAVWSGSAVTVASVEQAIRQIRAALGDQLKEPLFIQTVWGEGYRFVGAVETENPAAVSPAESSASIKAESIADARQSETMARPPKVLSALAASTASPGDGEAEVPASISAGDEPALEGHRRHAIVSSALYALACSVPVLLEIAYDFDRLGWPAIKVAPFVFAWAFGTTLLALFLDWKTVSKGGNKGLFISGVVLACAVAVLYAALRSFLPGTPVTRMKVQSHTAQAAYLHWLRFLVPLAGIFLLVPFHFVLSLKREVRDRRKSEVLALLSGEKSGVLPTGTLYLSVRVLGFLLLVAFVVSIPMTSHIMDNLLPSPHLNLFVQLVQLRLVLYFLLGLECLIWYSRALNQIKTECLGPPVPSAASVQSPTSDLMESSEASRAGGTLLSGGHSWHLLWVCVFYAALYVIALMLEVAYGFDGLGTWALALSPFVAGWIFLTSWLAVVHYWRKSNAGTCGSLGLLVGVAVGAALTLNVALFAFLPGNPVTAMVTPAQTAQAAYLKDTAFYFLPMAIIVWLIPFHFVCVLNRDFSRGNLMDVVALLRHERGAVCPEGTVYVRPDWLVRGLVVLGIICVVATQDLLSRSRPGPYQNLFMLLAILRALCAFAFCLSSVLWYRKALDSFIRRGAADQELSWRSMGEE